MNEFLVVVNLLKSKFRIVENSIIDVCVVERESLYTRYGELK